MDDLISNQLGTMAQLDNHKARYHNRSNLEERGMGPQPAPGFQCNISRWPSANTTLILRWTKCCAPPNSLPLHSSIGLSSPSCTCCHRQKRWRFPYTRNAESLACWWLPMDLWPLGCAPFPHSKWFHCFSQVGKNQPIVIWLQGSTPCSLRS